MKKLFFLLLLAGIVNQSNSQVRFGPTAGILLPAKQNRLPFYNRKTAWYAGAFSQIPLTSRWRLWPELHYSLRVYDFTYGGSPVKQVYKFKYLNAPVLVMYHPLEHFDFFTGPAFSYLLSASHILYSAHPATRINETKTFPQLYTSIDIGVNFTIGHTLGTTLRYNYGFSTAQQNSPNPNYSHSQVNCGLYYKL